MKIIVDPKISGFILAAAFFAGLGFGANASAQERSAYLVDLNSKTVMALGAWGGTDIEAMGINDAGEVVGWANIPVRDTVDYNSHAFITGSAGIGMRDPVLWGD
ncbi:hypothetical protein SAMN05216404_101436 [Nitrosospira multiformis]|uniref:Uncharacterized protein n=1 Tax=Nitrosospira multiformis TaxID=1231 RepID=A0A1H8C473_9PROT|nr:hypothetical protein [Nitrosospira multiformis]SEM89254.1 hypothetical protein SAMN05216404_101436 [Nitrosospira multiformis]